MSDTKKHKVIVNDDLVERITEERKQQAWAQFKKSALAVAEAYFAMSKEEREAMVEYVQDKCDEAEQQAKAVKSQKQQANANFNFCPVCGCKLNDDYNFCPKCGLDLTEKE